MAIQSAAADVPKERWIEALQEKARAVFAAQGLPHRRLEDWKYTDLKSLAELGGDSDASSKAGGAFRAEAARPGQRVESLLALLTDPPVWLRDHLDDVGSAISALNMSRLCGGAVFRANGDAGRVDLRSEASTNGQHLRHLIRLDPGAQALLVERITGGGSKLLSTQVSSLHLDTHSVLTHVRIVETQAQSRIALETDVSLEEGAQYRLLEWRLGEGLVRTTAAITLNGAEADAAIALGAAGSGRAHFDWAGRIEHKAPRTKSRLKGRAVLDGAATNIVQGMVAVSPGAQHTDSHQLVKALLLSSKAAAIHKPELEIYADDVKCGHGAATGGLDPNQLFYLQSRGIPAAEAQGLLRAAYLADVHEGLDTGMRAEVEAVLRNHGMMSEDFLGRSG